MARDSLGFTYAQSSKLVPLRNDRTGEGQGAALCSTLGRWWSALYRGQLSRGAPWTLLPFRPLARV